VRSSEELAQLTGYSTLGVVPIIRGSNNSGDAASFAADSASGELAKPSAQLITANEFRSAGSEAYRVLRTNILFSALANNSGQNQLVARSAENDSQPPGEPLLKTFLITSAIPKEGKSQTAANLAVVFAQTGSKVILVDTDLRKPTLHTYFGLPNEEGFSNLILSGPSDADTFLKKTTIPNLTLITAGTPPPNPSELLTSVKAALVIKALSDMSDIIIFDSPPAVLVSDAAILANRVDQVLLVFRSGSTRRAAISKAVTNLKKVGATVIGTVLNRVDEKDDGGYYYYGGYDYYAGSKKKNQKLKKAAKKG
jgi:capsular exopolysaccharide synthesis family protein